MIKRTEEDLRDAHSAMGALKGKWFSIGTGVAGMGVLYLVNNYTRGKIAATLPFEPWNFVKGMSHRGLTGDDSSLASMAFIAILVQMGTRGMIGKITGSDGPRLPMDQAQPQWLKNMQERANQ